MRKLAVEKDTCDSRVLPLEISPGIATGTTVQCFSSLFAV